ncbi:synaptotagmin VIII isoform X1 [Syngnathus typhle]|uniref:synaptotagmin VIII isoform X1 n=1 Tax=Syngnathus typhle TaxID=161592 RepID=UPI002A6B139E|nr:synaptotagmin VIII isoform X1 [Syngnathus typhle]XP_061139480.1 synaptotagmin VIII isoform X1 [Syngnathus typhle]
MLSSFKNTSVTDVIDGIIDNIPLPDWAVYALAAAGAVLLLLAVCCVCACCCRGRRKKRRQKPTLKLQPQSQHISSEPVQAGAGGRSSGAPEQARGKLLYSLEFDAALSKLKVGVKEARNLKAMDLGGTSDPYVKVYLLPDKTVTCETKVMKSTLNATFNETFSFQISKATLVESTAVLQVFDFDRFSKNDIIGELRLKLGQVDWTHIIEEWRDLQEPADMEEENLGEICFSLRYVPTSSKLTVVILEARNLKSTDLDGRSGAAGSGQAQVEEEEDVGQEEDAQPVLQRGLLLQSHHGANSARHLSDLGVGPRPHDAQRPGGQDLPGLRRGGQPAEALGRHAGLPAPARGAVALAAVGAAGQRHPRPQEEDPLRQQPACPSRSTGVSCRSNQAELLSPHRLCAASSLLRASDTNDLHAVTSMTYRGRSLWTNLNTFSCLNGPQMLQGKRRLELQMKLDSLLLLFLG